MARTVATKQVNELRDSSYVYNPVTALWERSTLVELASTNLCLQSESLDNASWTKTSVTISADATTAPDGASTADKLVEDSGAGIAPRIEQAFTGATDNTNQTTSFFVKAAERSWCSIWIRKKDNAVVGAAFNLGSGAWGTAVSAGVTRHAPIALTNGWYRISITVDTLSGATTPGGQLRVQQSDSISTITGDGTSGIYAWGAQYEANRSFPTSYIPTTTASVTRAVDNFSYPVPTTVPEAMTFYLKFIERGAVLTGGARLLQISESGSNASGIFIGETSGRYRAQVFDSGAIATSTSSAAAAPSFGDLVEARVTVTAAGVVQFHQTINAGSEASAAAGAAGGLPAEWGTGTARMYIGNRGGSLTGTLALLALKVARGSQSLANMRSFA